MTLDINAESENHSNITIGFYIISSKLKLMFKTHKIIVLGINGNQPIKSNPCMISMLTIRNSWSKFEQKICMTPFHTLTF